MTCDCEQTHQTPLQPFKDALEQMLHRGQPLTETTSTPLQEALDRVLAESITAPFDVPPHDNSEMDGYGLRTADLDTSSVLTQVGTLLAGQTYSGELQPGECLRIMTGAMVPDCVDAVVMQENVTAEGDRIRINQRPLEGNNIRRAGEDIPQGSGILEKGTLLGPADLGLLASLGIASVKTYRRVRVAVLSTGDELVMPGKELKAGQIYESNRTVIMAMLQRLNVEVIDLGIIPDQPDAIRQAFDRASACADIIISSGGVSVGDADFVKQILSERGEIAFWKLAMKPGKPFAFGQLGESYFMGLPGNPVSATVTFDQLVVPFIRKLSGAQPQQRLGVTAIGKEAFKKHSNRLEFQRARAQRDDDGQWRVSPTGSQGPGILSSISAADGYVILSPENKGAAAGEALEFQPFGFSLQRR